MRADLFEDSHLTGNARGDVDFLSREPVEGPALAAILVRGPIPLEDALTFAIEIGGLLGRAAAAGKTHGNLSTNALVITPRGIRLVEPTTKLALQAEAYRAPEQWRGEPVDPRTDIWAFGALLYTMLAGYPPFSETGEQLQAAVLTAAFPPVPGVPQPVADVLAACLEKERHLRSQRIQIAVNALRLARLRQERASISEKLPPSAPPEPPAKKSRRLFWPVFALFLLLLAGAAASGLLLFGRHPAVPSVRFDLAPPEHTAYSGLASISPDGTMLAFIAAGRDGLDWLWVRRLDSLVSRRIDGTEGAAAPFWSPDSRTVAFFADRWLKRVEADGSGVRVLCRAESPAAGGTWNRAGMILFAAGSGSGLMKVSAAGGIPAGVLRPEAGNASETFRWPLFLPGGKRFLFYLSSSNAALKGIYAGELDSPRRTLLVGAADSNAIYVPEPGADPQGSGYLVYIRNRTLMAQPFRDSALALTGEPIPVADGVTEARSLALAPVSASSNGVLVYQVLGTPSRQLVWVDRTGKRVAAADRTGDWGPPRIAPEGDRAVAAMAKGQQEDAGLWLVGRDGNTTELPPAGAHAGSPVWSPDGTRIISFLAGANHGSFDLWLQWPGRTPPVLIYRDGHPKYPTDWSRDKRYILFNSFTSETQYDCWVYSTLEDRAAPILETVHSEGFAAFTPDGKWVALQSDESGRNEIYVQPFGGIGRSNGPRFQISASGGGLPRWRGDGKELFYVKADGTLESVSISLVGVPVFDPPQARFRTLAIPDTWNFYDVSPGGDLLLLNVPLEWTPEASTKVTVNWVQPATAAPAPPLRPGNRE